MNANSEYDSAPRKTNWILWLGLLALTLLVVPIACCGGIALWGLNEIKAPLDAAQAILNDTPVVTERLGSPIEYQDVAVSNYRVENGTGSTQFNLEFKGPKAAANVDGYMELRDGEWKLGNLTVRFEDGEEVYLESVIGDPDY